MINSKDKLIEKVTDEYMKDAVMLNRLFFDFEVDMPIKDILEAYKELMEKLNGDIVRYPKYVRGSYRGNCMNLLMWLNQHKECERYTIGDFNPIRLEFVP